MATGPRALAFWIPVSLLASACGARTSLPDRFDGAAEARRDAASDTVEDLTVQRWDGGTVPGHDAAGSDQDTRACELVPQADCGQGQCEVHWSVQRPACTERKGSLQTGQRCGGPAQCAPGLQCDDGTCFRLCRTNADCLAEARGRIWVCVELFQPFPPGVGYCVPRS